MKKRLFALLLISVLLAVTGAYAEGWTCPTCGQTGNTGNFCSNCATAKPSEEWTCPSCGQTGNTGNFCPNCSAPRPDGSAGSNQGTGNGYQVSERLEQIPGETDRVKVLPDRVTAGTFISNKKNPNLWIPENAVDGDESTCWQFSAKKLKQGWICLWLDAYETIDAIWIKNGFWGYNDKGKDQYPINARPKKIRVEFIYSNTNMFEDAIDFILEDDRSDWLRLDIGRHEYVETVRITVISVYKGSAFPNDVCLSEIMLVKNASAETAMPAPEGKAATVYESRPDVTGANLLMKLATRSGPGTEYAEPGTFFGSNWKKQTVRVLKKKNIKGVWWVQVDFQNGSKSMYRVWTGAKRVDVDLNQVKEETPIAQCDVGRTSDTYFGPGGKYARANITITREAAATIFGRENGYVDVEYWYEDDGFDGSHRVWVPESAIYNIYYGDNSGEN